MSNKSPMPFGHTGETLMRDAVQFFAGGVIGNCAASGREWRRAQARDKRRAEGAEKVKAAAKKQAAKK